MAILDVLLCLLRWLFLSLLLPLLLPACSSPSTTTPIQTGGAGNKQQTGAINTATPVSVAPVIHYHPDVSPTSQTAAPP